MRPPFHSDPARDASIEKLRSRARAEDDDGLVASVHGYPGVGKTRLVAHALDVDDLRDKILYVNGAENLQLLLTPR
jgi:hypothetical protein